MTRNQWYWLIQIVVWSMYALLGVIIVTNFVAFKWKLVWFQVLAAILMLLSTHLFRFVLKRGGWLNLSIKAMLLRISPTIILLSFLENGIISFIGLMMGFLKTEEYTYGVYLLYSFQTLIYFTLWTGAYLVIHFFRNYKREEIEKWKLQTAVKDAELIALKAQINPHFLFNALNNIRALILENPMKARDMIDNISEMLRYAIQFSNREKVTVEEELEVVKKYLALESVHFDERLKYQLNAEPNTLQAKVPPMMVQLLAENAIKHGISNEKHGGQVLINISKMGSQLVVQVQNTGKLASSETNGIGIKNATERIRLLFDETPDFELYEDDNLVTAEIRLPYEP
jgi:two-component system, LytTR family, sensor kinase